ncbi:MAG: phosphoenolpyruvate carboxykinase, partial [Gaiellaceae bacterium]|nr:phosphoenolpyruvate carboxykinase [Gaiellaceae bacterium]
RMSIKHTRAMIRAILNGSLSKVETRPDPVFGVGVPVSCPDVPAEVLQPRNTWRDPEAYDRKARELAQMFADNFAKRFGDVGESVQAAGPNV